jgi:hypothetical protein
VEHAIDLDFGDREAGSGQQHATQRVAEGMAVAALERLDHDLGAMAGDAFDLGTTRAQYLVCGNRHVVAFSCNAFVRCGGNGVG